MSKQLYNEGDTIGNNLVVTAVSYSEDPETQERSGFTYHVRSKSEVEAEAKVQAEIERRHEEEMERLREEAERNDPAVQAEGSENLPQPESDQV